MCLWCNRGTLSQRSPEFGDGAGNEIGVDQEWADVSSTVKAYYLRVGHRGGSSMGVGRAPMLIVEIAGEEQGGYVDPGQGVGQRVPTVHEPHRAADRGPISLREGADEVCGLIGVRLDRIGTE